MFQMLGIHFCKRLIKNVVYQLCYTVSTLPDFIERTLEVLTFMSVFKIMSVHAMSGRITSDKVYTKRTPARKRRVKEHY